MRPQEAVANAVLKELFGDIKRDRYISPEKKADNAALLINQYKDLKTPHDFQPGDLVQPKKDLETRRLLGGVGIVTKLLEKPVFDAEKGPSSPYWNEPLDIVIGAIGDEGTLLEFHMNSQRLEPYSGNISETDQTTATPKQD